MARSRMIRPEFFDDEKLSECSVRARLLFIALWVNSDDYGVVKGNPKWLRAQAFPYDDVTSKDIQEDLESLERCHCILPFSVSDEKFYYIRNWNKYQKVNRPSKSSRNPEPPQEIFKENLGALTESSLSAQEVLTDETETETETEKTKRGEDTPPPSSEKKYVATIQTKDSSKPLNITEDQAGKWQQNLSFIDVKAELHGLEQWSRDGPQDKLWTKKGAFLACFNALKRKNQDALQRMKVHDPNFDPDDPDGSKKANRVYEKTMQEIMNRDPYQARSC